MAATASAANTSGTVAGLPPGMNAVVNAPSETQYITSAAQVVELPPELMRRAEEAQRRYSEKHYRHRMFEEAYKRSCFAVGMQTVWLCVGAWVIHRGWRYSDPVNSLVVRWASGNRSLCRLTTPICCLGWGIMLLTGLQLPTDVAGLNTARLSLAETKKAMAESQVVIANAYAEGKLANEKAIK